MGDIAVILVVGETVGVVDRDSTSIRIGNDAAVVRSVLSAVERDLIEVGAGAARDADVDAEYLGDFLTGVLSACRAGVRVGGPLLDGTRAMGESAAEDGIPIGALVDLYLSGAWRLWAMIADHLDGVAVAVVASLSTAVMRAADDTVAVLSEGYESGQRRAVRREESVRREFVDDLLSGGSDSDGLATRAARFGFNLAGAHVVLVAGTRRVLEDAGPVHGRIEALVLAAFGGRDVLVATKNGMLVCMFAPDADLIDAVVHMLDDSVEGPWHIGVGGTHGGPGGLLRSYREALNAIELAGRARLPDPVVYFERLLPQRLLAADPGVCGALASITLGPLEHARGGGEPLIETLVAYFARGGNVESTARRLHLSPRAVRYRLDRIASLTGRSVFEPEDRFVLELALRCRAFVGDTPGEFQPGT